MPIRERRNQIGGVRSPVRAYPTWSSSLHLIARLSLLVCIAGFLGGTARGDVINIGVFSFDQLNPAGPGSPGINNFTIANLTDSFSFPPDFPVVAPLTFDNVHVDLAGSLGPQDFALGGFGPGFSTPVSLQFLDSVLFSSASLTGTINQTTFALSDGTVFVADSALISASLIPAGQFLSPGEDFAVISVSGSVQVNVVPEPGGPVPVLIIVSLAAIAFRRRTY